MVEINSDLRDLPGFESLPTRAINCLDDNEIDTVEKLTRVTDKQLKKWENCGPLTVRQLKTFRDDLKFATFPAPDKSNGSAPNPDKPAKKRRGKSYMHGYVILDEVREEMEDGKLDCGFLALSIEDGAIHTISTTLKGRALIDYETTYGYTSKHDVVQTPEEIIKRIAAAKGECNAE